MARIRTPRNLTARYTLHYQWASGELSASWKRVSPLPRDTVFVSAALRVVTMPLRAKHGAIDLNGLCRIKVLHWPSMRRVLSTNASAVVTQHGFRR